MKAPKKLYVSDYGSGVWYNWHPARLAVQDIEYTRTDVLIEEACEWIKYNTQNGGCLFDGWEEDFKKCMEE